MPPSIALSAVAAAAMVDGSVVVLCICNTADARLYSASFGIGMHYSNV